MLLSVDTDDTLLAELTDDPDELTLETLDGDDNDESELGDEDNDD